MEQHWNADKRAWEADDGTLRYNIMQLAIEEGRRKVDELTYSGYLNGLLWTEMFNANRWFRWGMRT